MVKKTKGKKRQVKQVSKGPRRARAGMSSRANPTFGAVSTITTAPNAIGNSLRGSQAQILHTPNGVRVVGRDYCFQPSNTGTITGFVLCGGMPITPACMPSSILRNTMNMYNRFKCRNIMFHYITSSPTTANGDVMFYVRRNEGSAMPQPLSNSFLPYVLSDANTVIGPQWTNHSIIVDTKQMPWLNTDYGSTSEAETYSQYDLFFYSKTSTSDSPGYIIMDYEFEFKEVAVNPRAGNISNIAGSEAQWNQVAFGAFGSLTINTGVLLGTESTSGFGGTTINTPSNNAGDIYEFIVDATNSTFTTVTAANFAITPLGETNGVVRNAMTLSDGLILYYVMFSATTARFYTSKDSAYVTLNELTAGVTADYSTTVLRGMSKRIGTALTNQSAYSQ